MTDYRAMCRPAEIASIRTSRPFEGLSAAETSLAAPVISGAALVVLAGTGATTA